MLANCRPHGGFKSEKLSLFLEESSWQISNLLKTELIKQNNNLILNTFHYISKYLTESLIWTDIKQNCANADDWPQTRHQEYLMIFLT